MFILELLQSLFFPFAKSKNVEVRKKSFGFFVMFDTLVDKYINCGIFTYTDDMVTNKGLGIKSNRYDEDFSFNIL